MRLFLSSWDPQGAPPELAALVGANRTAAVVVNANDAESVEAREYLVRQECAYLSAAGFEASELDLREFVDDASGLDDRLASAGLVWVQGGNSFVLRAAMRASGFDARIRPLLETGSLAYGGYSAGAVVAGASLHGIELVDPVGELERVGVAEPVWDGMRLVDYTIAPHHRSVGAMRAAIDDLVEYLVSEGRPLRTLRDGQSILVDGSVETFVDHSPEVAALIERSGLPGWGLPD